MLAISPLFFWPLLTTSIFMSLPFSTSSNIFVGGNGGAIRAVGDSKLDIRFSMFRNNKARKGGAVYNTGDAYVFKTSFIDNVAEIGVSGA